MQIFVHSILLHISCTLSFSSLFLFIFFHLLFLLLLSLLFFFLFPDLSSYPFAPFSSSFFSNCDNSKYFLSSSEILPFLILVFCGKPYLCFLFHWLFLAPRFIISCFLLFISLMNLSFMHKFFLISLCCPSVVH